MRIRIKIKIKIRIGIRIRIRIEIEYGVQIRIGTRVRYIPPLVGAEAVIGSIMTLLLRLHNSGKSSGVCA